jgi:hypothetical protein
MIGMQSSMPGDTPYNGFELSGASKGSHAHVPQARAYKNSSCKRLQGNFFFFFFFGVGVRRRVAEAAGQFLNFFCLVFGVCRRVTEAANRQDWERINLERQQVEAERLNRMPALPAGSQ